MWLILTEPYDETGAWLAEGLRPRLEGPVLHLTSHECSHGASTAHGVEPDGAWFHVRLASGLTIDSRRLHGVVNRICALPPGLAYRLGSPQRDAAERNFELPLLRLLHDFGGPVLNRPTPQGICGDFRLDFEWSALAAQVGLMRTPARRGWQTAPSVRSQLDVVPFVVIGDEVLPLGSSEHKLPGAEIVCCRRLAALSRTNLLGVDFTCGIDDAWYFLRARPRASLVSGGEAVLAAVAATLTAGAAAAARAESPNTNRRTMIRQSATTP